MLPYLRSPKELVWRQATESEKSAIRAAAYPNLLPEGPILVPTERVSADQPPASGTNPEKE